MSETTFKVVSRSQIFFYFDQDNQNSRAVFRRGRPENSAIRARCSSSRALSAGSAWITPLKYLAKRGLPFFGVAVLKSHRLGQAFFLLVTQIPFWNPLIQRGQAFCACY